MYLPFPLRIHPKGFTLAELLISLAILGVIATFTIPKIISAQQNSQYTAEAKEAVAMITGAYQQAQQDGVVTSGTTPYNLTPYMNYVSIDTSGTLIDGIPSYASFTCNNSSPCLKLHNGGVLYLQGYSFSGTTNLHFIQVGFDPNGVRDITTGADGPGKTVMFDIYYNGFVTSLGNRKAGSLNGAGGPFGPGGEPSWYTW
jgi:prepilin-type N-terminal cleavage/methylation domain-containing protein